MFGSSANGLSLPTSDVDVRVDRAGLPDHLIIDEDDTTEVKALRWIARQLQKERVAAQVTVIARARIPILRFTETQSQLPFDLNVRPGTDQSWIQDALNFRPALRPVVLALKVLLKRCDLNDTHTGGVGSYLLLAMVYAVVCAHGDDVLRDPGSLLLAVLEKYAADSSEAQLIQVRDPAKVFDLSANIGRQAFRYQVVAQLFQDALRLLRQRACLSQLLIGWPEGGMLTSWEQLTAMGAAAQRAAHAVAAADRGPQHAPLALQPLLPLHVRALHEPSLAHQLGRGTAARQPSHDARAERQQAHDVRMRAEVITSVVNHLVSRVAKAAREYSG